MNETINIVDILGVQVLSRSRGDILREMTSDGEHHILNFDGVTFVSRAFADELCEILKENSLLTISNTTGIVKRMIEVVAESRNHPRKRVVSDAKMLKFDTMESLSEFLSKM